MFRHGHFFVYAQNVIFETVMFFIIIIVVIIGLLLGLLIQIIFSLINISPRRLIDGSGDIIVAACSVLSTKDWFV